MNKNLFLVKSCYELIIISLVILICQINIVEVLEKKIIFISCLVIIFNQIELSGFNITFCLDTSWT